MHDLQQCVQYYADQFLSMVANEGQRIEQTWQ